MIVVLVFLAVVIAVLAALAAASVRILREYERAVVFRLGRLIAQKGPGLIFLIPAVDRMVRVDLRTIVLDIPPQDLITRDNVPAKVNAVTYFRVIDACSAVVEVERFLAATSQIAQTTLRSVLGKADLDMLLADRERLNEALQQIIDERRIRGASRSRRWRSRTSRSRPACRARWRDRPRRSASAARR